MPSGFIAQLPDAVAIGVGRGNGILQMAVVINLKRQWNFCQVAKAVRGLVTSYPILGCRYSMGFWRDRWLPCLEFPIEQALKVEDGVTDVDERENFHVSSFIDPEKGWPVRFVLLNHSQNSRLLIIFPHLLGDGNAGLTVAQGLGAWLYSTGLPANIHMNRGILQLAKALGFRSIPTLAGELLREASKIFYMPFMGRWDQGFKRTENLSGRMNYHKVAIKDSAFKNFSACLKKHNATINDGLASIMAAIVNRRSNSSWTGTIYTVNLRRFLKDPGPIIGNMSGVNTLPLMIKPGTSMEDLIAMVAVRTGEHKNRLPGIAFGLLPLISFGWMPHGLLHAFYRTVFGKMIDWQSRRTAIFTNIGSMDSYLEPFGSDVITACMLGVFQRGLRVPVVMATGFRESLTVSVCSADDLSKENVAGLAADWREAVGKFADINGIRS